MKYQYIPYIWPLIISGIMTFTLGVYILIRYHHAKYSFTFAISMFVITLWSIPNALEMAAVTLPVKLFWANIQYVAYSFCPVTLLILVMQFTGQDKHFKDKRLLYLFIIPVMIQILVWTNNAHSLIRYDVKLDSEGPFPVISKEYGIAFYIHAVYSHTLNCAAMLLLIRATFFQKKIYRKQTVMLFIGTSLIVIPNSLYVLGISPVKLFDITPVVFGPCSLIIAWSMFRYHMFDLIPLAWATVIETMDAGVIVIDSQDRILDTNPAFDRMIGCSASNITSRDIKIIHEIIPELYEACLNKHTSHAEFSIQDEDNTKTYEILLFPLNNQKGINLARIALIYETTKFKKAQQEILQQQWKMAAIEEKQRIARDMHDNLGQVLGFINLQAQGISRELTNQGNEEMAKKVDRLVQVAQQAHTEIREYIQEIRTAGMMDKDFIQNIKNLLENFSLQTGIDTQLEFSNEIKSEIMDPNVCGHINNIIKESLNNIRKHSYANQVLVKYELFQEELMVVIRDDGRGFTLQQKPGDPLKTRFGLDIMRERADEIGARLQIESTPGQGCTVSLTVPRKGGITNAVENNVGR
jgi:PAS domain S-box-containing protein